MTPHQEKISLSPGELIHQETKRISWSPSGLKKGMVPHKEKISLSPGELIHQEDKRISLSPGGLKKYGTPPGENLLVSWWINPPGGQKNFLVSWFILKNMWYPTRRKSPGLLVNWSTRRPRDSLGLLVEYHLFFIIHQETKRFSWSPGGLIHQETRRFSPGGVLYS